MLLDITQRAIYDRLRDGPWPRVSYDCGRRHTSDESVLPGTLLVHPLSETFEVSDRCDVATEASELQFEALAEFACFVSPEGITDSWRHEVLRVEADGEFYLVYLRSVRVEEGPENGGSTRLTLLFQILRT